MERSDKNRQENCAPSDAQIDQWYRALCRYERDASLRLSIAMPERAPQEPRLISRSEFSQQLRCLEDNERKNWLKQIQGGYEAHFKGTLQKAAKVRRAHKTYGVPHRYYGCVDYYLGSGEVSQYIREQFESRPVRARENE